MFYLFKSTSVCSKKDLSLDLNIFSKYLGELRVTGWIDTHVGRSITLSLSEIKILESI